jgi:type I restriction enzyme S subunit
MSEWRDCKLGELLQIKHGYAFLGEHFGNNGTHVVLTPGNFLEDGGFNEKSDKAKWYSGPIPDDYVLKEGDLIVAMTEQAEGLLGSSALVPRSGVYLHNQRLGLVQILDREQTDQNFIYYLFNSKPVRQQIRASASGTKIRHTAPSRIAEVKVSVPPFPVQRRIAGILSAYDELIENSQRRIRILESMARALYREWFVHFRFPGHENLPRVHSSFGEIPLGCEVKAIHHFGKVVTGKTPIKVRPDFYGKDMPFVKTPDMHGNMFILGTKERLSTMGVNSQINKILPAGSICVSCIGTIGVVSITTEDCQTNQQINSVVLANSSSREYLFLRLQDAKQALENLGANGATMGNVNKSKFEQMEIICPPIELLHSYHCLVEPIFSEILSLFRQIQNLGHTRDLLLPRLLSGQINFNET